MILGGAFVVEVPFEVIVVPLVVVLRLLLLLPATLSAAAARTAIGVMGLDRGGVVDGDEDDVEMGINGREIAIGADGLSMFRTGVVYRGFIDAASAA